MAQPLIRRFVQELAGLVALPDPVVEFGAMQVEADQDGDLRALFAGRPFTGTDMRLGPGVDRVEDLRALSYGDGEVGTALCVDTLEHVEDPPQACRELARVTSPDGGVCVISSVMLFGIHGYPNDYFRFTPEGFRSLLGGFDDAWVAGVGHPDIPTFELFVARQRSIGYNAARLAQLHPKTLDLLFPLGEVTPPRALLHMARVRSPRALTAVSSVRTLKRERRRVSRTPATT